MASDSLNERSDAFNHSSCPSDADLQLIDRIEQLEQTLLLLARAEALTAVVLGGALEHLDEIQRHHYLATIDDLITSARNMITDAISGLRRLD